MIHVSDLEEENEYSNTILPRELFFLRKDVQPKASVVTISFVTICIYSISLVAFILLFINQSSQSYSATSISQTDLTDDVWTCNTASPVTTTYYTTASYSPQEGYSVINIVDSMKSLNYQLSRISPCSETSYILGSSTTSYSLNLLATTPYAEDTTHFFAIWNGKTTLFRYHIKTGVAEQSLYTTIITSGCYANLLLAQGKDLNSTANNNNINEYWLQIQSTKLSILYYLTDELMSLKVSIVNPYESNGHYTITQICNDNLYQIFAILQYNHTIDNQHHNFTYGVYALTFATPIDASTTLLFNTSQPFGALAAFTAAATSSSPFPTTTFLYYIYHNQSILYQYNNHTRIHTKLYTVPLPYQSISNLFVDLTGSSLYSTFCVENNRGWKVSTMMQLSLPSNSISSSNHNSSVRRIPNLSCLNTTSNTQYTFTTVSNHLLLYSCFGSPHTLHWYNLTSNHSTALEYGFYNSKVSWFVCGNTSIAAIPSSLTDPLISTICTANGILWQANYLVPIFQSTSMMEAQMTQYVQQHCTNALYSSIANQADQLSPYVCTQSIFMSTVTAISVTVANIHTLLMVLLIGCGFILNFISRTLTKQSPNTNTITCENDSTDIDKANNLSTTELQTTNSMHELPIKPSQVNSSPQSNDELDETLSTVFRAFLNALPCEFFYLSPRINQPKASNVVMYTSTTFIVIIASVIFALIINSESQLTTTKTTLSVTDISDSEWTCTRTSSLTKETYYNDSTDPSETRAFVAMTQLYQECVNQLQDLDPCSLTSAFVYNSGIANLNYVRVDPTYADAAYGRSTSAYSEQQNFVYIISDTEIFQYYVADGELNSICQFQTVTQYYTIGQGPLNHAYYFSPDGTALMDNTYQTYTLIGIDFTKVSTAASLISNDQYFTLFLLTMSNTQANYFAFYRLQYIAGSVETNSFPYFNAKMIERIQLTLPLASFIPYTFSNQSTIFYVTDSNTKTGVFIEKFTTNVFSVYNNQKNTLVSNLQFYAFTSLQIDLNHTYLYLNPQVPSLFRFNLQTLILESAQNAIPFTGVLALTTNEYIVYCVYSNNYKTSVFAVLSLKLNNFQTAMPELVYAGYNETSIGWFVCNGEILTSIPSSIDTASSYCSSNGLIWNITYQSSNYLISETLMHKKAQTYADQLCTGHQSFYGSMCAPLQTAPPFLCTKNEYESTATIVADAIVNTHLLLLSLLFLVGCFLTFVDILPADEIGNSNRVSERSIFDRFMIAFLPNSMFFTKLYRRPKANTVLLVITWVFIVFCSIGVFVGVALQQASVSVQDTAISQTDLSSTSDDGSGAWSCNAIQYISSDYTVSSSIGSVSTEQQEVFVGNLLQTKSTCLSQLSSLNPCSGTNNNYSKAASQSLKEPFSTQTSNSILYDISDVNYNYNYLFSSAISYPTDHVYFLVYPDSVRYEITTGKITYSSFCGIMYSAAMGKNNTAYMVLATTPTARTLILADTCQPVSINWQTTKKLKIYNYITNDNHHDIYVTAYLNSPASYFIYKLTFPTSKTAALGTILCTSNGMPLSPIQMTVYTSASLGTFIYYYTLLYSNKMYVLHNLNTVEINVYTTSSIPPTTVTSPVLVYYLQTTVDGSELYMLTYTSPMFMYTMSIPLTQILNATPGTNTIINMTATHLRNFDACLAAYHGSSIRQGVSFLFVSNKTILIGCGEGGSGANYNNLAYYHLDTESVANFGMYSNAKVGWFTCDNAVITNADLPSSSVEVQSVCSQNGITWQINDANNRYLPKDEIQLLLTKEFDQQCANSSRIYNEVCSTVQVIPPYFCTRTIYPSFYKVVGIALAFATLTFVFLVKSIGYALPTLQLYWNTSGMNNNVKKRKEEHKLEESGGDIELEQIEPTVVNPVLGLAVFTREEGDSGGNNDSMENKIIATK